MHTPPGPVLPNHVDLRQLDWNLLRAFVVVAEQGSLTRAAEALGTSQPTLSRQITALEETLGRALFERTARGLSPTPVAQALMEPARRVHEAVHALGLAAAGAEHESSGTVRLTASEMTSAYVLPPLLRLLRDRHPAIQIELVASNRVDNLLEREADIAVRMVEPTQGSLITRHVADYTLGLYAHRDYLAHHGMPEPQNFAQHQWIGFDRSDQMIVGFRMAGFPVNREFFALRTDNHLVSLQAIRAGLGIGVAMQRVAASDPLLVQVLEQMPIPPLPVWLTSHRELRDTPRIRHVYDFLAEALAHPV